MNYFNQFENFNNLPSELQDVILSEYTSTLSKVPEINTKLLTITKQSYIDKICTQPISKKEIKLYKKKYNPDTIYYFFQEHHRLIHMGVLKFMLQEIDIHGYHYTTSYDVVEEDDHSLTYQIIAGKNMDSIILNKDNSEYMTNIELDLLTQYTIYKDRKCEQLKPYFARNLILNHLKNKYNEMYKINYKSLLMLYVYLRVNLLNFPFKLPNLYEKYIVTLDDEDTILASESYETNGQHLLIDPEELLNLIQNSVIDLYKKLVNSINMLN